MIRYDRTLYIHFNTINGIIKNHTLELTKNHVQIKINAAYKIFSFQYFHLQLITQKDQKRFMVLRLHCELEEDLNGDIIQVYTKNNIYDI